MRLCEHCKADIAHKRRDARFCDRACKAKARHAERGAPPRPERGTCQVSGCDGVAHSKLHCTRHYQQQKAGKALTPVPSERQCSICGAGIGHLRSNALTCSKGCKAKAADRRRNARPSSLDRKHARRARQYGNRDFVPVTSDDWVRIKRLHNECCAYCGERTQLQMDHVVPLSRGGRHAPANIAPACIGCNTSKGGLLLSEWRLKHERG